MMAVAIERGVPGDTPTAAVLHNLLTVSFPCAPPAQEAAPDAMPGEDVPGGTAGGERPTTPGPAGD